jgi:hypothetical protein
LANNSVDELQQKLYAVIAADGVATQQGKVRIPKTKFEFKPPSDKFLKALQKIGLPETAQVLEGQLLELSGAHYVGKAETSEEGIKMAAAQAIVMREAAMPPLQMSPIVFDGNRSMVQLVVKDDQVLFFNPITNPTP